MPNFQMEETEAWRAGVMQLTSESSSLTLHLTPSALLPVNGRPGGQWGDPQPLALGGTG